MSFRKKATFKSISYAESSKPQVYLNGKKIENYSTYYEPQIIELKKNLKNQIYNIKMKGGGTISQTELVPKILYKLIEDSIEKQKLKEKFLDLDRTDVRRNYPKRYGGPKARKRSQKSYR